MCSIATAWEIYNKTVLNRKSQNSRSSENARWKHIINHLDVKEIHEIKNLTLVNLASSLEQLQLSPQSVKHCLSLLRRVLHKAIYLELYSGSLPHFYFPRFDNNRDRYLSKAEANKLLETLKALSPLWHDISMVALFTGLRAGEIFKLQVEHFDQHNKRLKIVDTKTTKNRSLSLNPAIQKIITQCTQKAGSGLIFPNSVGKSFSHVGRPFWEAVHQCGFNDHVHDRRNKVVFHTLRHTFASWLVLSGTPLAIVSKLMGHSSMNMTMRYSHLSLDEGAKFIAKLHL